LAFIEATPHIAPNVDEATGQGYRWVPPYSAAKKFIQNNHQTPIGRANHPAVLLEHDSAKPIAHGAAHDSLLRQNGGKPLAAHTATISHREIVLIQRNLIVPTMVLLIRPTETITMKALAPTAH